MGMQLIIALDFACQSTAWRLVDKLDPALCAVKVGSELFTRFGPVFVTTLVNKGFHVFLDLKFHDIPNTVAQGCRAAADLGVWMLTVHASGGLAMMESAQEALVSFGSNKPLLMAVTVLTSMQEVVLPSIGITKFLHQQVQDLAMLAKQAALDGVVCAAGDVPLIKSVCGANFLAVTPGIRLSGDPIHDQSRVFTPREALNAGSDYLVVGRSITQARDPVKVVAGILSSMESL